MTSKARGENHPNAKLTDEDVEQIRQLIEWKKEEIARINSIASSAALAEKFEVSKRCIESISTYRSRCNPANSIVDSQAKSEQTKRNISSAKLAKDNSAAGAYERKTGNKAIDVIQEMSKSHTATHVARHIGWSNVTCMRMWMKLRGFSVDFKRIKSVPPKHNPWGSIDLSRKQQQPRPSADPNTL